MKLIRNALITPDGTVIESRHRHDYVTHVDANGKTYMVDGGLDYQRRSMHGDEVDVSLFDTEPHHIQRCILNWGTYGKDGNQPYKRVSIAEMETDHIEKVLEMRNLDKVIQKCLATELLKRTLNEIQQSVPAVT